MKRATILLLLIFTAYASICQIPVAKWSKVFHEQLVEEGYYINTTSDGGSIVAGQIDRSVGDVTLRKLDANGTQEWKGAYGGSGSEGPAFVQQVKDGGYLVIGSSHSDDGDIKKPVGNGDIWVFKVDGKGVMQWQKMLGTDRWDSGINGKETSDGGYIIMGVARMPITDHPGYNQDQILLVKLNRDGMLQWEKMLGGPEDNSAAEIQLTPDGGFVIVGSRREIPPLGQMERKKFQYFVMKLGASGDVIWEHRYGAKYDVWAKSIAVENNGDFVVVGTNEEDCMVIKIDSTGKELWRKIFGDSGVDIAERIILNVQGEIIVAGVSVRGDRKSGWLFKLDEKGLLKWDATYGEKGTCTIKSVCMTLDGGIIGVGNCYVGNRAKKYDGNNQLWVLKVK